MEGAALAAKRHHDRDIALAWHTAVFALQGYGGKLKGKKLSDFLSDQPKRVQTPDEILAALEMIRDGGAPMSIRQIN